MSSRNHILANIARSEPPAVTLPILPADRPPTDLLGTFRQRVESISGQVIAVQHLHEVAGYLKAVVDPSAMIVHNVPGLDYGTDVSTSVTKARDWALVDLAILRAEFGVAENGAVWLDDRTLPNRALPFICQHLVLVLSASSLVPTLHEAYRRLQGQRFNYGVFIAGPSKTADIEQSLVIGAHGARSLLIFLLADH